MYEFPNPNGLVVFIAANHGEEPNNKATFDLIRQAFAKNKFQRVIIEGLENDEGVSPKNYVQDIEMGRRKLDEPAFTVIEAKKKDIEFIGGEVSDKNLLEYIQENGFTRKDMAGFYILRSWTRDSSVKLDRLIDSKRFPVDGQFASDRDFFKWFENMYGQPLQEKDPHLSMPFQNREDKLQELANQITWARDRFLAKVIQNSAANNPNVLVVYGSGHYVPQRCFMEKWIGKSGH